MIILILIFIFELKEIQEGYQEEKNKYRHKYKLGTRY
jgi:hypothetical protein